MSVESVEIFGLTDLWQPRMSPGTSQTRAELFGGLGGEAKRPLGLNKRIGHSKIESIALSYILTITVFISFTRPSRRSIPSRMRSLFPLLE